jgi:lipopolysaccharide transport system permease protein
MPLRDAWIITANFLQKLQLQRTLLRNLVIRDLRNRYVGSLMGVFWSVIHPVALLLTYAFVLEGILKLRPWKQAGTDSFAIVIFSGILPWLLFQDTVLRSSMAVLDHANLVKKTKFPVEIVPLSIFLANLLSHIIGLAILLLVLAWFHGLTLWVLVIPIFWVFLLLFSVGLGWIVGVLQVFLRDTTQILGVLMTLWFWFTPIFYSAEMVPEWLKPWVRLNPMASVITGYHHCLLRGGPPEAISLLFLGIISIGVFILGGVIFRVAKREFVDVL